MVLLSDVTGERHVYFIDTDNTYYVDGEPKTKEEAEQHFNDFRKTRHAMITYTKGGTVRCIHENVESAEKSSLQIQETENSAQENVETQQDD